VSAGFVQKKRKGIALCGRVSSKRLGVPAEAMYGVSEEGVGDPSGGRVRSQFR